MHWALALLDVHLRQLCRHCFVQPLHDTSRETRHRPISAVSSAEHLVRWYSRDCPLVSGCPRAWSLAQFALPALAKVLSPCAGLGGCTGQSCASQKRHRFVPDNLALGIKSFSRYTRSLDALSRKQTRNNVCRKPVLIQRTDCPLSYPPISLDVNVRRIRPRFIYIFGAI